MSELFLSVDDNNKILDALPFCKLAFECIQKRLSAERFWANYETLTKYNRMRCLLCVSGLNHVPKPIKGE